MMRESVPAEELLKRSHSVGQYYGFGPLSALLLESRGTASKGPKDAPEAAEHLLHDANAEAIGSFLRQLRRGSALVPNPRQPLFLWHTNVAAGRPAPKKAMVQFHAIGADRALADVVVIRAALALVRDLYREEPVVHVNSMGDKETRARYARELGNYFRRRAATLPEECVSCAKRDALEAAELATERELAEDLPVPTEHLSDASRKRFEDVLEYLELTETPYELARTLITRGSAWNELCFEITVGGKRAAWGSRYGELAKHFFGAPMSATGALITISSEGASVKRPSSSRLQFAFVHIGDEAKRLSLRLAEEFRKARLPLTQDIGVESLTEQMHLAERRKAPYLLIMGRKEALEGSAILRNRATQEETVLPLSGLAEHLKAFA
jgi:histidyl-tRNA synthetase